MISPTTPGRSEVCPEPCCAECSAAKARSRSARLTTPTIAIVAHDRNSLDPVFLEEAGDFWSLGCFGNPDHWGGHDFSSGELRVPEENAVLLTGDRKFESISLQQTVRLSPAATFERREPGLSPQVCEARLTTGSAETQQAFHSAPTGGNVSAGPYSSTAVPLMRSAAMPRRSERNQEFPGFSVGSL